MDSSTDLPKRDGAACGSCVTFKISGNADIPGELYPKEIGRVQGMIARG